MFVANSPEATTSGNYQWQLSVATASDALQVRLLHARLAQAGGKQSLVNGQNLLE